MNTKRSSLLVLRPLVLEGRTSGGPDLYKAPLIQGRPLPRPPPTTRLPLPCAGMSI